MPKGEACPLHTTLEEIVDAKKLVRCVEQRMKIPAGNVTFSLKRNIHK